MKLKQALIAAAAALALAGAASAAPIQWTVASGGNGHWYEFIDSNVDWNAAFAAANAATFMGMQGYLATATSAGENRFIAATVAGSNLAWLGGSDDGSEGVWTWRNGPEAGQQFYDTPTANSLMFTNWNPGEPNNCCGGENFLHVNFGVALGWNDHGGPGNPGQLNGYVIEYPALANGLPEPATWMLLLVPALLAGAAARRR